MDAITVQRRVVCQLEEPLAMVAGLSDPNSWASANATGHQASLSVRLAAVEGREHDVHLIYLPVDAKWDPYRVED
jgi:hypothetical protein